MKHSICNILSILDKVYGTTKKGFLHTQDWQLLVAIMLSAQSTDKQVEEVLPYLWKSFPQLEDVANASVESIEQAIRTIGLHKSKAKNMKKCCTQLIVNYKGKVPMSIEELIMLAGVGRKTATLFLADAYGIPGVTVDTHVFRISKRLGWTSGKNPVEVEQELMKILPKEHWNRINFQLIYHGRAICTARKAYCEKCELETWCKQRI
ncbi:endonuclease III [Lachnospiraceae bacterium LCP25S3_G4]